MIYPILGVDKLKKLGGAHCQALRPPSVTHHPEVEGLCSCHWVCLLPRGSCIPGEESDNPEPCDRQNRKPTGLSHIRYRF